MWDLIVSVPDHCLSFYSDILSFMEPKIGNFFSTFSCILVSLQQISRSTMN